MTQLKTINILHLYPRDMNIYGDNGNVQVLVKRCEWHGYSPTVTDYNPGDTLPDLSTIDIIIGGGGQDSGQDKVHADLLSIGPKLKAAADDGMPMLMICGLYQLFGNYFKTHSGLKLDGIGIFNAHTIGEVERLVGNTVVQSSIFGEIVGYENHSGQTFLSTTQEPLGEVILGAGNNPKDANEGALYMNVIGSYLHGPLLPKNPTIADYLISVAATNRYDSFDGQPIDDSLAMLARKSSLNRPR